MERVFFYSFLEGARPVCGLTTNVSAEDVLLDIRYNYDQPRHITVLPVDDMGIDAEGQIYGPIKTTAKEA